MDYVANYTSLSNSMLSQANDNTNMAEEKVTASIADNQNFSEAKRSAR